VAVQEETANDRHVRVLWVLDHACAPGVLAGGQLLAAALDVDQGARADDDKRRLRVVLDVEIKDRDVVFVDLLAHELAELA